jgi:hypothetical protein
MRLVVVPPVSDPTLTWVARPGERLLDLNQRFASRAADPAVLTATATALDVPGPVTGAETSAAGALTGSMRCLLARAAADALTGPAGPATRLQALAAAIRVISAGDRGLAAAIDDVELRAGSTQSSGDVALAAARCTLFDPELSSVPATAALQVVIDTDQQLPAALRLLGWLRAGQPRRDPGSSPTALAITASGRFAVRHWAALSPLPALAGVRLDTRPRPRVVSAAWAPGGQKDLRWCDDPAGLPGSGHWAGWLDAAAAGGLTAAELKRCDGLVVSVTGAAAPTGPEARARVALIALAGRVPVAVEIVTGAPGGDTGPGAWWALAGSPAAGSRYSPLNGIRLAGFRPYRPPLAAGAAPPPGQDLARWAAPASPAALAEVSALLARHAAGGALFPGRVAGALYATEDRPQVCGDHYWDPAVRLVRTTCAAPDGGGPGDFLVSLRSGAITRVRPALAALLAHLREGGPPARRAVGALPGARRERLLTGLIAAGAIHHGRSAA